MIAQEYSPLP